MGKDRREKRKYRKVRGLFFLMTVAWIAGCFVWLLQNKGDTKQEGMKTKEPLTSISGTPLPTELPKCTGQPEAEIKESIGQPEIATPEENEQPEIAATEPGNPLVPTVIPTVSPMPTATPVPVLEKLFFSSSETIPVISVQTEEAQPIISREEYVNCEVTVGNVEAIYDMRNVKGGIRVRGNSSAYYGDEEKVLTEEVPYRIKFEKKCNLLGLNDGAEFKSWVLLRANKGLIRDDIALRFGRLFLGERYYCSDARLVHLYVNDVFKGVYLLCEQSQVNRNRIEINEPDTDETGIHVGYLLEIDNYANADAHPYFRMNYDGVKLTDVHGVTQKITYANYSIKSEVRSKEQETFIASYMKNMFHLVYEACVNRNYLMFDENYSLVPAEYDNAKDTIEAVMDTESVAAMYMVYEIMRDRDGGEGSFYMCVDFSENSRYPKLTFLCPWDFDWTCQGDATGRYYAAGFDDPDFVKEYGDRSNPWFILLAQEEWFMDIVRGKWNALQKENGAIYACIEEERQYLELYEADLNRKRSSATVSAENLLKWIERRVKWLDEEWLR